MTCQEVHPLLNAYFDRELDISSGLDVERHLRECPACTHRYELLERLQSEIAAANPAYEPSSQFERRLRRLHPDNARASWWAAAWKGIPLLAAAAALALVFILPWRASHNFESELIDGHMRSLIPGHLVDVPSTDQHTVKPWFQGKLTFSPRVPNLDKEGFPLVGGRLEVIDQRQAASIIYKRRDHIINLYVLDGAGKSSASQLRGFNVVEWTQGGLSYWAVSDLNAGELRQFAALVQR